MLAGLFLTCLELVRRYFPQVSPLRDWESTGILAEFTALTVVYCFLPRDEPPLILLGASVVGPGAGFTPTPCLSTGLKSDD